MLPEMLLYRPFSTLFVIALAFAISLSTTLLNRKFMNKEQTATWQHEINKWNAEKNMAKRSGDKKLLAKVKKQEPRILQLQSKMFSQRMKTFLITFIPLIVLWQVLIGFFQNRAVAYLPGFSIEQIFELPFFWWYLICSFFVGTILSRIFGVEMEMGLGTGTTGTR